MAEKTPEEIALNRIEQVIQSGSNSLNLRDLGIVTLPSKIEVLANLVSLDLSNNRLWEVPESIRFLTKLKYLEISLNPFSNIPEWLFELKDIEELHIGHMGAIEVDVVGRIPINGKIESIPASIKNLDKLRTLDFSGQSLKLLPPEIGELKNLAYVDLNSNSLTTLPSEIGNLKNLVKLDLRNNQLRSLPREIRKLKKLETLRLANNPLPVPPEILQKVVKSQAIISYIYSLARDRRAATPKGRPRIIPQTSNLNECKVIFIGQGNVGKTSIIKRLIFDKFSVREPKTKGVSISRWQVHGRSDIHNTHDKINLNVWDFGGQEILHATHQFFFHNT